MLSEKHRLSPVYSTPSGAIDRSGDSLASARGVDLVRRGQEAQVISQPGRLAGAAAVWMGGTFALCYLLLPLARAGLGLSAQSVSGVVLMAACAALSLAGLWVATTVGLVLRKPVVSLESEHRDRAVTATVGGLLVWTVAHNVLPGLVPFGAMEAGELLSFFAANVLESALFGVMLASVAKTVRGALRLGVLFQGILLLSSYVVMLSMW
ncbi:MAG: hypothetical protein P8R54_01245 [Myxococcota bacterium]|nr:hypothetical protein [Myxococcota bacterium]